MRKGKRMKSQKEEEKKERREREGLGRERKMERGRHMGAHCNQHMKTLKDFPKGPQSEVSLVSSRKGQAVWETFQSTSRLLFSYMFLPLR